ncbi:MAG: hypothetical protein M3Y87_23945 [Myxococcota bacterium]|nr:hypothetical protein [Myxococcota bacterium]
MRLAASSAVALAALVLLAPALARAGDIEDFEIARTAYESGDYERAVIYFEQLVGGESPRLESPALVTEARKYLGASYLFVGRRDAARDQFERLLRAEPTYVLDPLRFPVDVQELFESVRERLEFERREADARARLEARAARADARARDLVRFAEEEVSLELPNSRWLALVPFGVGQFQNGNDELGWAFLVTEVLLAGTAVAAQIWWQEVNAFVVRALDDNPLTLVSGANQQLEIAFAMHWTAVAAFAAVTVGGIIEAQVDFVPTRVVTERRTVPGELREGADDPAEPTTEAVSDLRFGVGLGGASLSFRF